MKKIIMALAFMAAAIEASPAQAEFIVGQQSFSSPVVAGADNISDTVYTFSFVSDIAPSQQTGDYVGTGGAFINTLDVNDAASFVFGDNGTVYGTFFIDSVIENISNSVSRTLNFEGRFVPSATTFPGFEETPGSLTITINQPSAGPGEFVLSASATLITAAAAVPEPATIVMLGTFCVPVAFWGWKRRRHSSRTSS